MKSNNSPLEKRIQEELEQLRLNKDPFLSQCVAEHEELHAKIDEELFWENLIPEGREKLEEPSRDKSSMPTLQPYSPSARFQREEVQRHYMLNFLQVERVCFQAYCAKLSGVSSRKAQTFLLGEIDKLEVAITLLEDSLEISSKGANALRAETRLLRKFVEG